MIFSNAIDIVEKRYFNQIQNNLNTTNRTTTKIQTLISATPVRYVLVVSLNRTLGTFWNYLVASQIVSTQ